MLKYTIFLLASLLILLTTQCRKPKTELEKLPPETQTGAETFGCLVNGKMFKPKGSPFGGPILSCAYQRIRGGYYFQLSANRDQSNASTPASNSVSIATDSLAIGQGRTYQLTTPKKNGTAAQYSTIVVTTITNYLTSDSLQGELKITKFDETARIVSGTFWFDGVNSNGEKVEVRQGRFDLHYTL